MTGGLVLAAVARVRSQADLTRCRSNLRQLGLSFQTYADTTGGLPPLTDQGDGAPTGAGLMSPFSALAPYIEARPDHFRPGQSPPAEYHAHSSVTFTYGDKGAPDRGPRPFTEPGGFANRPWQVFLDPADHSTDQQRDVPVTLPDGTTGYYAPGSYAVNGLLAWGVKAPPERTFPRGLADTVLAAERPRLCRPAAGEPVFNLWGLGVYSPHMPAFAALTPADPPGLESTGQVAPVGPLPAEGDADIRVRVGRRDAPPQVPDFASPVPRARPGGPCDPRLPAALHPAGMQVLMANGSVRVFAADTGPWAFWSACVPEAPDASAAP